MVAVVAGDAGEFQRALAHAERAVAVAVHDAVGKGTVVRADPHRAAEILAEKDEWGELLADALQFRLVLIVRVFADLKFLFIGVVAGVHTDFLHPLRCLHGGVGFEMDVSYQGNMTTGGTDFAGDVLKVRCVNFRLRGDAHNLTTGFRQPENLLHARGRVAGVGRNHRLHTDRVHAADTDISDHDFACQPSGISEEIRAVGEGGVFAHWRHSLGMKFSVGNGGLRCNARS